MNTGKTAGSASECGWTSTASDRAMVCAASAVPVLSDITIDWAVIVPSRTGSLPVNRRSYGPLPPAVTAFDPDTGFVQASRRFSCSDGM